MSHLHLFEGYGVELEYMIVDRATGDVRPIADALLESAAGQPCREWQRGDTSWCNELALHVIEFKFSEPWKTLEGAIDAFAEDVRIANDLLRPMGATLLPGAMHPWMNPFRELKLWPHENEEIYQTYNDIFDCRGHGWANLQSTHINLPFGDDDEFGRLHAAIRLALPLLPGLAASSPFMDGRSTGRKDNRLFTYRDNAKKIPSVTGRVIPEPVFSIDEYHSRILQPMYNDIAPLDPNGVLQDDWLNSRGAIARFERQSIEIRLLDIQECPAADLGMVELVSGLVQALVEERWSGYTEQRRVAQGPLVSLLNVAAEDAENAPVLDEGLLEALGLNADATTVGKLWLDVADRLDLSAEASDWVAHYAEHGTLATRILRHAKNAGLQSTYAALGDSLTEGRFFE